MRIIITTLVFCFFFIEAKSQSLLEALGEMKTTSLPFQWSDSPDKYFDPSKREPQYNVSELSNKIPINNSYTDLNGTIKDTSFDDTEILLDRKFPNKEGRYFFHVNSNYTDASFSGYLILMGLDGVISDYLWVELIFETRGRVTTMNFKIDDLGNTVTVYQIKSYPLAKGIDPYNRNITSFTGQRIDKIYTIANGKFVLTKTRSYIPKVYMITDLGRGKNIWDGTETPQ